VAGQKLELNTKHKLESVRFGDVVVSFDVKGFWGPYTTQYDDGYSKQYWYNTPSDKAGGHSSSITVYCGAPMSCESFSDYGVASTETIDRGDGRVSLRGESDGYFYRADYYCSSHLMIAYYYVTSDLLSFFDNLLDTANK
jgi:hypothetical protein